MGLLPFQWQFLGSYSEGASVPPAPAEQPLFPSFTHENSFLSLPTSSVRVPRPCLPNLFPLRLSCHTKPTSCLQLQSQGGSPGFYLQVFGRREAGQGWGRRGEGHTLEEIKLAQRSEAEGRMPEAPFSWALRATPSRTPVPHLEFSQLCGNSSPGPS